MKSHFNTIVSKFSQIPEGMGCKAVDARLLHRKGVEKKQNIDMTAVYVTVLERASIQELFVVGWSHNL